MQTITIKDFYGQIKGYIEIDHHGKKTVMDFYRKILGYYDPRTNQTTDFYGKVIAKGDFSSGLIDLK